MFRLLVIFAHMRFDALGRYAADFEVAMHGLRPITFGGDKRSVLFPELSNALVDCLPETLNCHRWIDYLL